MLRGTLLIFRGHPRMVSTKIRIGRNHGMTLVSGSASMKKRTRIAKTAIGVTEIAIGTVSVRRNGPLPANQRNASAAVVIAVAAAAR